MKHPLPSIFEKEIARTGQYRTLREELVYDFESSLYRGAERAVVRLLFTLHPQDEDYGATVVFQGDDEDEWLPLIAAPIAQGMWLALAEFRLTNVALLVQEVEAALSDDAAPLLVELGERAVRHALHEADVVTHRVPGWVKPAAPERDVPDEEDEGEPRLSGAETRAARELRRRLQRELDEQAPESDAEPDGPRHHIRRHTSQNLRQSGHKPRRPRRDDEAPRNQGTRPGNQDKRNEEGRRRPKNNRKRRGRDGEGHG